MSHSVPDSNNDDNSIPASHHLSGSNSSGLPLLANQMAELTWQNGQLEVNGLTNLNSSTIDKETWEISGAAVGTLESIVDLATQKKRRLPAEASDVDVPWLDPRSHSRGGSQSAASACNMDALVPCGTPATEDGISTGDVGRSARVEDQSMLKRARQQATRVSVDGECCSLQRSQNGGEHVLSPNTSEKGSGGFGPAAASFWSQGGTLSLSSSENPASSNKTATLDYHDSVYLTNPQEDTCAKEDKKQETVRSSLSTKRSRAAAVHNQYERKRRETINQKLKMLQKMVPNSSKTDKASMLDEVIEYLKQLQAQVHLMTMSRMSMPSMMMPFAMPQQQLHMPIMSPMGMGMGMDMNIINPTIMARQNLAGLSSVISPNAAFMPMAPTDPALQPMTIEAYSRMIALIQHQQMASTTSKN